MNKKVKQIKVTNEETKEVKTLIIITLVIIVISVGLYFLTDTSLNKKKTSEERPEATISYSEIIIGTMFSRPYSEYYVLAYKDDNENAKELDSLFTKYEENKDSLKIYYIDLANKFNESALSDKSNKNPEKATDVKIKDQALILIKNGKVSKYYEKISDIKKALS